MTTTATKIAERIGNTTTINTNSLGQHVFGVVGVRESAPVIGLELIENDAPSNEKSDEKEDTEKEDEKIDEKVDEKPDEKPDEKIDEKPEETTEEPEVKPEEKIDEKPEEPEEPPSVIPAAPVVEAEESENDSESEHVSEVKVEEVKPVVVAEERKAVPKPRRGRKVQQ